MSPHFLHGSNLYLIGMMGAGKSTVGKRLAKLLGYGFLDTDDLIALVTQQSIPQIFAEQGESAFREIESQVLSQVVAYQRQVVATGGGIILDQFNWSYLQEGVVIWLDVPVEELVARLQGDRTRPLLQADDLREKLSDLMVQRQLRYAQADVRIEYRAGEGVDAIATRILTTLQQIVKSPLRPANDGN